MKRHEPHRRPRLPRSATRHTPPATPRPEAGMALVVTLAVVVLVTIAAMAFFTRATSSRTIEHSRANQVLAAQLAETAQDYVVGQFLKEMTNNARVFTNGNAVVLQVTNPAGMVPQRLLAQSSMTNDTNFANLVRQSVPGADPSASAHSAATAAQNGRLLGPDRWNAPLLNSGAGFNAANQLPNWIYMNRDGTATATPSTNAIGRFAYNVYGTGGLLDANVAGHPGLSGADLQAVKGTLAGADLGVIPGVTNASGFVDWRNPGLTGAAYVAAVTNAATNGFLNFSPKALASRQDLIRLAKAGTAGISTNALPYLAHYSRAANAPSWGPSTNATGAAFQYKDNATNAAAINRFLPSVLVKSSFTRRDGTPAKVGDPLVKNRFPLSKLAWVGKDGPAAPGTAATIQRDFGLKWQNNRWEYVGHSGTDVQTAIKTLDEVASENREANFFELLKAGILSGSVGKAPESKTLAGLDLPSIQILEGNPDLQITRIGACLIDQADADNFPTHINIGGVTQHGVEDLPYLYSVLAGPRWMWSAAPPWTSSHAITYALLWVPQIWMPHAASGVSASSDASMNPQKVRIRILNGILENVDYSGTDYDALNVNVPVDLTSQLPVSEIQIKKSGYENYRASAKALVASDVANIPAASLREQTKLAGPWWTSAASGQDCGFVLDKKGGLTFSASPASATFFPVLRTTGVILVMEYEDGGGWHVYDSLGGSADLPGTTGINASNWAYGILTEDRYANSLDGIHIFSKWDPRTTRWGPTHGWSLSNPLSPPVSGPSGLRRDKPFPAPLLSASDNASLFGLWPQGDQTPNSGNNIPGTDNIWRPNDAFRGDAANPFRSIGDTSRRPVILQRPFRTVGEMGYTFRDTPWQTLSFFDATSGDQGLLDLFSVEEGTSIMAGQVNLNTAPLPVLQAVLEGTPRNSDGTGAISASGVAADFKAFREAQAGSALFDRSQLASFISSPQFSAESAQILKGPREAAVRGLADAAQTGAWNLTADIVAQSGRFAPGSTSADRFIVEGEDHTWLHLSLDRLRGQVVFSAQEKVSD